MLADRAGDEDASERDRRYHAGEEGTSGGGDDRGERARGGGNSEDADIDNVGGGRGAGDANSKGEC